MATNPRLVHRATLVRLRRDLDECTQKIERLERALEINIRRMAAMQAEIDYLRATRQPR